MSATDVRDLTAEKLPVGKFPADVRADFRLHISPQVRRGIEEHARADVSVEICGVLVGNWGVDENGPYADVTDYIRCDAASSKSTEVTFTHESWAHINKEMDSKFVDSRIIGWYHSHPDFGIFLSDRDCFIHEHFFSGAGQIAYVIDPVRGQEGAFAWRNGKPAPLAHYWVGDQIRTVDASGYAAREPTAQPSAGGTNSRQPAAARNTEKSSLGMLPLLLGLLGALLLGYLYGGWRSRWEQQMIIEGAVAHLANSNLIREGFEEDLAAVRTRLHAVNEALQELPEPAVDASKEELAQIAKQQKLIRDHLMLCEEALARIEERYGLSESERMIRARIVAQKQAELQRMLEAPARSSSTKTPAGGAKPKQPRAAGSEEISTPAPTMSTARPDSTSEAPTEPTPRGTEGRAP